MAKVIGPFGGFGASQSVGKTYTFFPWKGLNVVRRWVKGANPNTEAQQLQRNNFEALVLQWHSATETAVDKVAWNKAASIVRYKPQSGFNRFIGIYRSYFFAGKTHSFLDSYTNQSTVNNAFGCALEVQGHVASDVYTLYYGDSPSSLWHTDTGVYGAGEVVISALDTKMAVGARIYFQMIQTRPDVGEVGRTGIYEEILTAPA
jgi:hypothetical protein